MAKAKKSKSERLLSPEVRRQMGVMGSVLKSIKVLEVFGSSRGPVTIAQLSRETGWPKSTLHRILATLIEADVVEQGGAGKYVLTLKLWRIGISALADLDLIPISVPHLESLSAATDETVHLARLEPDGMNIVYLWKVESPRSIRVQTQVGQVAPSWCTATGRAILSNKPGILESVLAAPKEKRTPETITDANELREILNGVSRNGLSVTKVENHPEMGGIAAPIRDHKGEVVASCGVAIPAFRMDADLIDRCSGMVNKTAAEISSKLGYVPEMTWRFSALAPAPASTSTDRR